MRTFHELDCAILAKCKTVGRDITRTQIYSIFRIYDSYDSVVALENQSDLVYEIWESLWDTYAMIIGYYEKYPDLDVIIVWPAEQWQNDLQMKVKRIAMTKIELGIICVTRVFIELAK